jgi:hypothetical protein
MITLSHHGDQQEQVRSVGVCEFLGVPINIFTLDVCSLRIYAVDLLEYVMFV